MGFRGLEIKVGSFIGDGYIKFRFWRVIFLV